MKIETKFVNEECFKKKTPIEPRKPDTKFREAEKEAEASHKKILRSRSRGRIHQKTAFKEAEAEAEASNFRMLGSRSRPGSQYFREKLGFRKPKLKPASSPTLIRNEGITCQIVEMIILSSFVSLRQFR